MSGVDPMASSGRERPDPAASRDRPAGPVPDGSPRPDPPPRASEAGETSSDPAAPADGDAQPSEREGEEGAPASSSGAPSPGGEQELPSVEDLVSELEAVIVQRDEYLALAQQKQAEFENFRKRTMKQQAEQVARASSGLVTELLPVLDAFDYGVGHGDESLAPMRSQLLSVLERAGLERLDPEGAPFDPNEHEAVAHEPGDEGEHVVAETLRAGYRWKGQLLRAAMVRVRG